MKFIFTSSFEKYQNTFEKIVLNFKNEGTLIGSDKRNAIKYFEVDGMKINVKSFKQPNFFNKIIYSYFRKSKARRSFEFAIMLQKNGFGTPEPMAYLENFDWIGLTTSYYFSRQLDDVFMFREAIFDLNFENRELITKKYTQFFFNLHEKGIEFVDNTSGNTLIRKTATDYEFFLVDLNRMNFHQSMSLKLRISNLAKLTNDPSIIKIISEEYARLLHDSATDFYKKLLFESDKFQNRFQRRRNLKKKLFLRK